ncbi:nucleosomal histone kinase 1 [Drosophila busckii]|nr:nucleosomal histone kinase 1 [Drosophila busckii]
MPRAAAKSKAKPKGKLYAMPEKLKLGTVLTDQAKGQWRIGASIGIGGFGEIYAACRNGNADYDAVVKCEPHLNGPLFVEMHFYLRNAKLQDIQLYKQQRGIKALGMPHVLAHGSVDINEQKHRFVVMPRYGSDIAKFFEQNGRRLPEATVYRLAIQMLDAYEFIHSKGYVHADLKAANMLLGLGQGGGAAQAYLVDFGLASRYTQGAFKPDPKKMHNGTIEYIARDAHLGVPTRRADLEILGYNLIEWLGVELPWVKLKLLALPAQVQKAKETFMANVSAALQALFQPKHVPAALADFMLYVAKLTYNEAPDYDACRCYFLNELKRMKVANSGDLDFKLSNNKSSSAAKQATARGRAKNNKLLQDVSADEQQLEALKPSSKLAAQTRISTRSQIAANAAATPKALGPNNQANLKPEPALTAKLLSPALAGKTTIISQLNPQAPAHKTYEFDVELDVSLDANVIVNVSRKKKTVSGTKDATATAETSASNVNVRKVASGKSVGSGSTRTTRSAAVTMSKYLR